MLDAWRGPLLVKGILSAADAQTARATGAAGVVVSNHGGRQLDHAPATLGVLPSIVHAVGADIDVLIDSGVRRGSDIVKALALGAKACLIGRPYLYGLGAAGEAGVAHALRLLRSELRRTMALVGARTIDQLDESVLSRHP
jgi:isopentenyl diphosphate isomerase/L-lactate dehydrogenase-like FMN-dependent dehydrogenase